MDRESAALLYHIPEQRLGRDLVCVAWNSAAPFMFAVGNEYGTVQVWTAVDTLPQVPPEREQVSSDED